MDSTRSGVVRRVVAYMLMSLDGVAEEPSDFITEWDDVMDDNLARVIATQDTVLLGRHMYEEWARFWPESDIEPFASFINAVPKYVVTSSELTTPWSNCSRVDGDLAAVVAELKSADGGDIGVHGSIALTQSMLEAGLVDDLHLVVAPVLQGHGRPLFVDRTSVPLTLTSCVTSPSGALLLEYRVG